MTVEQIGAGIIAAVLLAWPKIVQAGKAILPMPWPKPAPAPAKPAGFEAAVSALSLVRGRITATELLDDKAKAAVDTLTLALVAGSDK
jgi:hypothetical protein